jgi:hypothetical protein
MIEFKMVGNIPGGDSAEDAIAFLDSLDWNISYKMGDFQNKIYAGEGVIFQADTSEACEAFLLGMAISLAVLPDDFLDQIRGLVGE